MNLKKALTQAIADFKANPRIWNQGSYARDEAGYPTDPRLPNAVCWCVVGRVSAISGVDAMAVERELNLSGELVEANDYANTLSDALEAFEKII